MEANFWIGQAIIAGSFALIAYLAGRLVEATDLKVNYTRKINFFAIFLLPLLLSRLLPYEKSFLTIALRSLVGAGMFIVLIEPVRRRVPMFATMFRSFDRPEDRPHTLMWLSTQIIVGNLVLVPMGWLFAKRGISELMFVPVLIHGIGDGLAEPVGIRWGRHRYSTRVLLSRERRFTRSYEGSACVFIAALLAVLLFHNSFTVTQLVVALLTIPLIMTLAEAWSPHTWDTPYMFLAGTASLLAVKALI